jgi:hypothetical protein
MLLEKLPLELVEQVIELILDDDNPRYLENLLGINKPFEQLTTTTLLRRIRDKTSPMARWRYIPLRIRGRMARDTILIKPSPGTKRDIVSYMQKVVDTLLLYANTFDPNGAGLLSREEWLSEVCDILAPHEADCQCGKPAFMHQKCYDLAFVHDTAFHIAILGGHTALEIAMIEDGRSFNSICPYLKVAKRDPRFARSTALEWACAYGLKDSVQRLVEVAKLERTKPETYIPTAAAIAAAWGHLDLLNILIGYIANLPTWETKLRYQNQTIYLREWNRRVLVNLAKYKQSGAITVMRQCFPYFNWYKIPVPNLEVLGKEIFTEQRQFCIFDAWEEEYKLWWHWVNCDNDGCRRIKQPKRCNGCGQRHR